MTAEEMLYRLVRYHFWGEGLEWGYREGIRLEDTDPVLYEDLRRFFREYLERGNG